MSTYAQVIETSTVSSAPYVDDTMPEGVFGVTVKNIGGIQTYFFRGDNGQEGAPIVGRIHSIANRHLCYRGGGVMGGTPVHSPEDIFNRQEDIA